MEKFDFEKIDYFFQKIQYNSVNWKYGFVLTVESPSK